MLIRNFSSHDIGEDSTKREMGLIDARRNIYLFVDKLSYELKNFVKVKTAIINESVYDSKYDMIHPIKLDNSHVVRKGIYFGEITCAIPGNIQSKGSFFVLNNSVSSERSVQFGTNMVEYHGQSVYSSRMAGMSNADKLLLDVEYEVDSIPPQYYSTYQMYTDLGDFYDLNGEGFGCRVNVEELIDNSTTYQFMDISKFDTMRLEWTKNIVAAESKFGSSIQIPSSIGSAFNTFEGRNQIFVYDSDAFGIGKWGMNVTGGIFPQGKFFDKQWLADNLRKSLEYFGSNCKDIENQYGHVRVLYSPDAIGNKYKIRFKDYKVSPIVPLGKIDNNGNVDQTKSDGVTSGIDSGYITDRSVCDNIEQMYKSQSIDFMKQTQGW